MWTLRCRSRKGEQALDFAAPLELDSQCAWLARATAKAMNSPAQSFSAPIWV
jgi:hypothetical protein